MVYKIADIKHLELMDQLVESKPYQDEVIISKKLSFDEKILNLCNELRSQNFNKHADAIENKFLQYKSANANKLYNFQKETGESLIESAHPDGDTKASDEQHNDLSDVETSVSKHKKIVNIVQKEPTGKLASYINICKVIIAQDEQNKYNVYISSIKSSFNQAYAHLNLAYDILAQLPQNKDNRFFIGAKEKTIEILQKYTNKNVEEITLQDYEALKRFTSRLMPYLLNNSDIDNFPQLEEKVKEHISQAINFFENAIMWGEKLVLAKTDPTQETIKPIPEESRLLHFSVRRTINKFKEYKTNEDNIVANSKNKEKTTETLNWLDKVLPVLESIAQMLISGEAETRSKLKTINQINGLMHNVDKNFNTSSLTDFKRYIEEDLPNAVSTLLGS